MQKLLKEDLLDCILGCYFFAIDSALGQGEHFSSRNLIVYSPVPWFFLLFIFIFYKEELDAVGVKNIQLMVSFL